MAKFRPKIDVNAASKSLIIVADSESVVSMNIRVAMIAGLFAISGCTTIGLGGTKSGADAVAGSAAASQPRTSNGQIATKIIGAMAGGLIGGSIGSGLNEQDRRSALEAEYRALEYTQGGQSVSWKSERSGRYGEVVAAQPYRVGSQDCRQYTHTVFVAGQPRSARGTACRNADGSWTPLT